jgi:KAP family P-loop domain
MGGVSSSVMPMDQVLDYRILLDEPAERPALRFDHYARAFAAITRRSEPRFAIGIFGDWGSGKTTLMRAIEREVQADEAVVTLWFNAWRYEREEHLIVPLLDTLREALKEWAERPDRDPTLRERAKRAAATVSRAAGALLAGLSITAGIPGAPGGPSLKLDVDRARADWRQREEEAVQQPRSLYHAVFRALQQSLAQFVEHGRQRIVVFVDDLDRCLPTSALEVLESMKLFFDLEGFVFVVGLDREVVQRAVELKYRPLEAAAGTVDSPVKGSEYIKKIFQVPFSLPAISVRQVNEFLASFDDAGLPVEQREDLWNRVRPHLDHVITETGVNPREIKRYLNSYTLQLKINPSLNANVILGLQTLAYREEWRQAYEVLLAEREVFTDAVRRQRDGDPAAVENLWPELAATPRSCFAYLESLGKPLLEVPSLDPYLHSIESAESTHSGLVDAYRVVGNLRGILRDSAGAPTADRRRKLQSDFREQLPSLISALSRLPGHAPATRLQADVETLVRRLDPSPLSQHLAGDAEGDRTALDNWQRSADELLVHIQTRLREVRQTLTVGRAP